MESRDRVQLHECCVVPFRRTPRGVEFCLVTPQAENRWEFPKVAVDETQPVDNSVLAEAAETAGLRGVCEDNEPLGQFVSARGDQERNVKGFLMKVVNVDDRFSHAQSIPITRAATIDCPSPCHCIRRPD